MRPCINARCCEHRECDPEVCGDYVPALASTAVVLAVILAALICCCIAADAVSLNISGHSSGSGLQNLSFSGDQLNVSILQNLSGWNITMEGAA